MFHQSLKQAGSNTSEEFASGLCLFPSTASSYRGLENLLSSTSISPVITKSWVHLKPVVLTRCTEQTCPKKTKPSIWNAIYFLRVFHSSVWSMILLFICTTAALLFMFEQSHPCKPGRPRRKTHDPDIFNLQDCFMYVTLGLVLRPFHKTPKSWAGLVLSVFWCAFCVICLIAYAVGTGILLLQSFSDAQLGNEVVLLGRNKTVVSCDSNELWCSSLRDRMGYRVRYLTSNSSWLSADTLLTDQLTAHFLMSQGYQHLGDGEGSTARAGGPVRWVKASLVCPITSPAFRLSDIELGFISASPEAAWSFNKYLLQLEHSGFLSELMQLWNGALDGDYEICHTNAAPLDSLPIGLLKMNGPVMFIVIGSLAALLTHIIQFIFLSCFNESTENNDDGKETQVEQKRQTTSSNQSNL